MCLTGCGEEREAIPYHPKPVDPNDPLAGKTIIIRPDGTRYTVDHDGRHLTLIPQALATAEKTTRVVQAQAQP
jgi:hypothetical protein